MSHARFKIDVSQSQLAGTQAIVSTAQACFATMLRKVGESSGLTRETYVRYLSFQYHLTRDVQRAFLAVAAHPTLADRRALREFLFTFALEEEPHYSIAEKDLAVLGCRPLDCPLDVLLWWAYFNDVIRSKPFVRLGATCVLENLGAGGGEVAKRLLDNAGFITQDNSRFIRIHFHEALPHGDQIYRALASVPLSPLETADLEVGAAQGAIMYLRMAAWALRSDAVQERFERFLSHSPT